MRKIRIVIKIKDFKAWAPWAKKTKIEGGKEYHRKERTPKRDWKKEQADVGI